MIKVILTNGSEYENIIRLDFYEDKVDLTNQHKATYTMNTKDIYIVRQQEELIVKREICNNSLELPDDTSIRDIDYK